MQEGQLNVNSSAVYLSQVKKPNPNSNP